MDQQYSGARIAERLKQISREHAQMHGKFYVKGGKYVNASRIKSNLGGAKRKPKKMGPKEKLFRAFAKKVKAEAKRGGSNQPSLAQLRPVFNKRYDAGCMNCK